ncbi:MAG: 50S ribosomal protein P1 [Thermoprotei archaeon]|nr:MAG: 50S ribosomal protein P1 [Thermoprotei archaeon]
MEYVYASLLLHYAGKPINEENVRKVLEAAGIAIDEVKIKALVAALKEVNIDEAIKSAAIPMAVGAAPAPAAAPAEAEAAKAEEKKEEKEEKKEELEEEELAEGLAGLFG